MPRRARARAAAASKSRVAYHADTPCGTGRTAPERSGGSLADARGGGPESLRRAPCPGGCDSSSRSSRAGGKAAWVYTLPAPLWERVFRC